MKLNFSSIIFSCIMIVNSIVPASSQQHTNQQISLTDWNKENTFYFETFVRPELPREVENLVVSEWPEECMRTQQAKVMFKLQSTQHNFDTLKKRLSIWQQEAQREEPLNSMKCSALQSAIVEVELFETLVHKYRLIGDTQAHDNYILGKFHFIWEYLDYFHVLSAVPTRQNECILRRTDMEFEQEGYALQLTRDNLSNKFRKFFCHRERLWRLQNPDFGYLSLTPLEDPDLFKKIRKPHNLHAILFSEMRSAFFC